jgi:hypothetical protein
LLAGGRGVLTIELIHRGLLPQNGHLSFDPPAGLTVLAIDPAARRDGGRPESLWSGTVPAAGRVRVQVLVAVDAALAGRTVHAQAVWHWGDGEELLPTDDPRQPGAADATPLAIRSER